MILIAIITLKNRTLPHMLSVIQRLLNALPFGQELDWDEDGNEPR